MADSTKLVLLGGAAAAVWWFYFRNPTPATSTASGASAMPTVPGTASAPSVPLPPGANTVAGIQAATLLAANAPAAGLGVDDWGYNLNLVLAPLGKTAPDPGAIFETAIPGFSRGQLLTAAQYWSVMGPALRSQLGLTGLGMYGGR